MYDIRRKIKKIMPFKKPCKRCDKKFQPTSYFNKICDECKKSRKKK